jgi:predicted metallo-beta-lactamase superfamily hydrolase
MTDAHQAVQGREFWRAVGPHCRLEPAEGRTVELDGVTIRFSPPLPHGPEGSGFGYVVAVTVDDGERFIHASTFKDRPRRSPTRTSCGSVRSRLRVRAADLSPGLIGREVVQRGIDNLVRLVGDGLPRHRDHHAVREPRFCDRLASIRHRQGDDFGGVLGRDEARSPAGRALGTAPAPTAGRLRGCRRPVSHGS